MTILVTGAAGFIGYHLSKKLLEANHQVIGVDNINTYYSTDLKYARLEQLGVAEVDAAIAGLSGPPPISAVVNPGVPRSDPPTPAVC